MLSELRAPLREGDADILGLEALSAKRDMRTLAISPTADR